MWLPRSTLELEIEEPGERGEVEIADGAGHRFGARYYPHPECLRHPPIVAAAGPALDVGPAAPIKELLRLPSPPGSPAIAVATLDPPRAMPPSPRLVGRGVDWDPELAALKARMEAIERYCACMPPRAPLHWGTPEAFASRVPAAVAAPAGQPRWWCQAQEIAGSAERVIPLEYVQLASLCAVRAPLVRADSTGMAVHVDRQKAIAAGLIEALERAGLAQMWSRGASFRVEAPAFPEPSRRLVDACRRQGYRPTALLATPAQGFTACMALLRRQDTSPGPALVCGAGGGWSLAFAIERALMEAYAQLQHAIEVYPSMPSPGLPHPHDHFLFYHDEARAAGLLADWNVEAAPEARDIPAAPAGEEAPRPAPPALGALVVDRGNALTDHLGLSALQVLLPHLRPLAPDTPGPAGWPTPLG
ncbi:MULTISPECIES: YcaO-like family protein [Sorangium]|uniref:YcaO-like family protein n=1 Tax=Sorangium TaxID=39643 RepID=UPI003D9C3447